MRKIMVVGLALVMALSLVGTTAFAANESLSTTASISFDQGYLEFVDTIPIGHKNMNIYFGSNTLPLGEVEYYAKDGPHTLRVSDPNPDAGGWRVTVKLSPFVSEQEPTSGSEFIGDIELSNHSKNISNNDLPFDDFIVADPLLIVGNAVDGEEVMHALQNGFTMGWFDATWPNTGIKLTIDEINALKITDEAAYVANMTWTLVVDVN